MSKNIIMIGPAINAPGGVSAVIQCYQAEGLFTECNIEYIPSYHSKGTWMQLKTMLTALLILAARLITKAPKAIHVHSASRGSFWRKSIFCLIAKLCKIPYIFHLHSGEFPEFFANECSTAKKRYIKYILANAKNVFVLTNKWAPKISEIEPTARIEVIPNPIAIENIKPNVFAPKGKRLLFLGRLREKKGVYDLLEAIAPICKKDPQTILVLAGDGEIIQVREYAEKLGILQNIETPGWIDGTQKEKELSLADALVLPSHFEGLPICILEAMAHGVPVIATDVGGIPDTLENGKCGLLVQPRNIQALREGITTILNDADKRKDWREKSLESIKQIYCSKKINSRIKEIYASITI